MLILDKYKVQYTINTTTTTQELNTIPFVAWPDLILLFYLWTRSLTQYGKRLQEKGIHVTDSTRLCLYDVTKYFPEFTGDAVKSDT